MTNNKTIIHQFLRVFVKDNSKVDKKLIIHNNGNSINTQHSLRMINNNQFNNTNLNSIKPITLIRQHLHWGVCCTPGLNLYNTELD